MNSFRGGGPVKAILNATGERGKLNLNYNPFRQH
jgi:hypothetical protein